MTGQYNHAPSGHEWMQIKWKNSLWFCQWCSGWQVSKTRPSSEAIAMSKKQSHDLYNALKETITAKDLE